jgi:ribosomal protein L37AE/L43A
MFAEAAQKKVQSNWRGIPPNEHSKEWQRSINRATGMRGMNWYVTDPSKAALRKNLDFPEGYAYVCRKCKETTFIKYGSFIQCKSCAHRRAKRWYQRNAESKRQIELARYHHNKTRKLADDHPSTPDS